MEQLKVVGDDAGEMPETETTDSRPTTRGDELQRFKNKAVLNHKISKVLDANPVIGRGPSPRPALTLAVALASSPGPGPFNAIQFDLRSALPEARRPCHHTEYRFWMHAFYRRSTFIQ